MKIDTHSIKYVAESVLTLTQTHFLSQGYYLWEYRLGRGVGSFMHSKEEGLAKHWGFSRRSFRPNGRK